MSDKRYYPFITPAESSFAGQLAQEWSEEKDKYTLQGQFALVLRMMRKAGWTIEPPKSTRGNSESATG